MKEGINKQTEILACPAEKQSPPQGSTLHTVELSACPSSQKKTLQIKCRTGPTTEPSLWGDH